MCKFIGIDIGGTKCAVVVGDENGNIAEKIRFIVFHSPLAYLYSHL